jgi:hypothetical protein
MFADWIWLWQFLWFWWISETIGFGLWWQFITTGRLFTHGAHTEPINQLVVKMFSKYIHSSCVRAMSRMPWVGFPLVCPHQHLCQETAFPRVTHRRISSSGSIACTLLIGSLALGCPAVFGVHSPFGPISGTFWVCLSLLYHCLLTWFLLALSGHIVQHFRSSLKSQNSMLTISTLYISANFYGMD